MRRGAKPAKGKVEPELAAARKSLRTEASKRRELEKRLAESLEREKATGRALTEALEQQTATSEILRVISSSPTDLQPVLNAVAENAARLCGAADAVIFRVEGDVERLMASYGEMPISLARGEARPLSSSSISGRAALERRLIHVHDMQSNAGDEYPDSQAHQARIGYRTILTAPLLREDVVVGTISIRRIQVQPFSDNQIGLLKTFADQAVIAIENVRLFKELDARNKDLTVALEQQTATSEILRVISSSQTDVQPVFDTIVSSAVRLCDGLFGALFRFDGELLHQGAEHNFTPEALEELHRVFPARPTRALLAGRAILERAVVHILDIELDPEYRHLELTRAVGARSLLYVPMLREGAPLGVIGVLRAEPGPFSESQIELLKTFADQAVIAIENVRLFKELQARTGELTQSVEKLTALGEVSRAVSSTLDVETVLDMIVSRASQLAGADGCSIYEYDEATEAFQVRATHNLDAEIVAALRTLPFRKGEGVMGRAAESREPTQIPDIAQPGAYQSRHRDLLIGAGYRALLAVPLLREDQVIGSLSFNRKAPGEFPPEVVEVLKTFATQSALAIQNARLFREIADKSRQLENTSRNLEQLYRLSTAMQEPLSLKEQLNRVLEGARQAIGIDRFIIWTVPPEEQVLTVVAEAGFPDEEGAEIRGLQIPLVDAPILARSYRENVSLVFNEQNPIPPELRLRPPYAEMRSLRTNNLVAVAMMARGLPVGVLSADNRWSGVPILPHTVELLQTFASHAAVAIENARLFRELADKSRQLEVASQHKSEFLANMSHELRTPLNAIIGFSEVLIERMFGELNAKQDEYLKDIYASGQHLLSLINDILDLSKVEAGRMELELTDFDLPQAIQNALILVRERATRRGIALNQVIGERVGNIRGDERKVKQALLNLLSNAIKFTPEGGRIEVRAAPAEGMVEMSVTDTGAGIAPEDQEAVFEEFRQVGGAEKKAEGTGLGLALSRKFIELHGGRIWVKSQVGAGSTFTFTLPVRRGE